MKGKALALVFAVSTSMLLSSAVLAQPAAPKSEPTKPDSSKQVGRAQYSAIQMRSGVKIIAVGFNPTTGYKNVLEKAPLDVFPPQYRFLSIPPKGPAGDALTFFKVEASFPANQDVAQVEITDADGVHKVEVFHSVKDASARINKDGPFPMFK